MQPETVTWIDPAGGAWNLNDTTRYYIPYPGLDGGYGTSDTIVTYAIPGLPGDHEQYLQILPTVVNIPLLIFGSAQDDIDRARRALYDAMRPTRGVGTLRHVANDGTSRDLYCRETSGFRTVAERTPSSVKLGLTFRAADPYWYDSSPQTISLTVGGTLTTFFGASFFPIQLAAGGLSSGFTVSNDGQAETFPVWTIVGPGVNPLLTNTTTGDFMAFNVTLTAGQVLTIDTRPGGPSILREDGSNQWGALNAGSTLWSLVPGSNALSLGISGTTSASALQLQYQRRWESV